MVTGPGASSSLSSSSSSSTMGSQLLALLRRNQKVLFRLSVGVFVATPTVAMIQGIVMLNDYRFHHRDAPRPIMPARGVVIADGNKDHGQKSSLSSSSSTTADHHPATSSLPPLRLLVVGDSLAAGVGMAKSGTPKLPESIARALSQASGGRVVYWTCVGTPGASASQIVQEIKDLKPPRYDSPEQSPQLYPTEEGGEGNSNSSSRSINVGPRINLERLVKEWQYKRQLFLQRRQERILREQQQEEEEEAQRQEQEKKKSFNHNALKIWWAQLKSSPKLTPEQIQKTTTKVIQDWWSWISHRVQDDLTDIQQVVSDPTTTLQWKNENDNDDERNKTQDKEQQQGGNLEGEEEEPFFMPITTSSPSGIFSRWSQQRRRHSVNPNAVVQYDIAIVLTGLNDIKEAFLPFMMTGQNASVVNGDTEQTRGGLGVKLKSVLKALRHKMVEGKDITIHLEQNETDENKENKEKDVDEEHEQTQEWDYSSSFGSSCLPSLSYQPTESKRLHSRVEERDDDDEEEEEDRSDRATTITQQLHRPLIVVPALPVARLELFQTAPLCFFLKPLFRYMEENPKVLLSQRLPHLVLFVPQPSLEDWKDMEAGRGPLWESVSRERILYKLVDVADHVLERIQQLMQQHYNPTKTSPKTETGNVGKGTRTRDISLQEREHLTMDQADQKEEEQQHRRRQERDSSSPPNTDTNESTDHVTATSSSSSSNLIGPDNIHPNDTGYEIWGQHIAAAIIEEWKWQETQKKNEG